MSEMSAIIENIREYQSLHYGKSMRVFWISDAQEKRLVEEMHRDLSYDTGQGKCFNNITIMDVPIRNVSQKTL